MKKLIPASLSAVLVMCAGLGFTACSTVNLDDSGDTQAVYQLGEFEMVLYSNAATAYAAAEKALKQLDLYETKAQLNPYDAQLYARARNDDKISIGIKEINSRQTMLKIRWGTTGNKARSRALYEAIDHNMR